MSSHTLSVGVVGVGFIGPVHVEALRRLGLHVAAIVGLPDEAERKARELNIPVAYTDLNQLLGDPSIDVVHVASPNHLHYPHVKAVLEAGKHVVCEKPLAMNSTESAELVALARSKGLVHAVNFNVRFYPMAHEARQRVRRGDVGTIRVVQGSYLQDWLMLETDWNWRLEPEFSGIMRAVADIGSHWLDLLTYVTGLTVESVCADFATFLPVRLKPKKAMETFTGKLETAVETEPQEIHTEDYASILIRFAGGARGVLTVSQVSPGRKNRLVFEVDGARCALAWESERPNELWIGHRDRPNEQLIKDPSLLSEEARAISSYPGGHNEGFPDTFKQLYSKVYRAVESGTPGTDYPTFEDGHLMLRLGEAILLSAREDRWVKAAEIPA